MPYIKKFNRYKYDNVIEEFKKVVKICNAGELNYLFSKICLEYFKHRGDYQAINDIIGALDGCKAEFQRRVVSTYEDLKIKDNGDLE